MTMLAEGTISWLFDLKKSKNFCLNSFALILNIIGLNKYSYLLACKINLFTLDLPVTEIKIGNLYP
jgi:hypothetical protein